MSAIWDGAAGIIMAVMLAMPLWLVKAFFIAIFVGLAVWAMRLPKTYAVKGAPDKAAWRDVRWWAVAVIVLEILPYLFF